MNNKTQKGNVDEQQQNTTRNNAIMQQGMQIKSKQ
jgi:hypothetical protein